MTKKLLFLCLVILLSTHCQYYENNKIALDDSHLVKTKSLFVENFNVSLEAPNRFVMRCYPGRAYELLPVVKELDTLLFICNFLEDGWLVIPGDNRLSPILAEDDKGALVWDALPDGLYVWFDSLAEDVWLLKHNAPPIANDNTIAWSLFSNKNCSGPRTKSGQGVKWYVIDSDPIITTTGFDFVPHLIQTAWGQGAPWNSKCPVDTQKGVKCFLGCTATAVAQLLVYSHNTLSKPNRLYHTINCSKTTVNGHTYNIGFSRNDLNNNSSRWAYMPIDKYGSTSSVSYAGDLMLDIGNRFNMYYSGSGSGADISASALCNYYDLSYTYGNYDISAAANSIYNDSPVVAKAASERGFLGIGYKRYHEWLIDGVYTSTTEYRYTKSFDCSEDWIYYSEVFDTFEDLQAVYGIHEPTETVERTVTTHCNYWLMNWGYDGQWDSGHYGTAITEEWNANNVTHLYDRKIYYDFN